MTAISWAPASEAETDWDSWLAGASDRNVFQSHLWAEVKRPQGWDVVRLVGRDSSGNIGAMVQVLLRKAGGRFVLGWAPGGPIMGFAGTNPRRYLQSLSETLRAKGAARAIRLDCYLPLDEGRADFNAVFHPPMRRLNTGFTALVNLSQASDVTRWSTNHRRNFRRAEQARLKIRNSRAGVGLDELFTLYERMRNEKGVSSLPDIRNDVTRMVEVCGTAAVVFTAHKDQTPVAAGVVLTFADRAIYIAGGTSAQGRRFSAGHALFHAMFTHLAEDGIDIFDLGGLDPGSKHARGVDLFKLGFGAEVHERVGEWDWARTRPARLLMNAGILMKSSR